MSAETPQPRKLVELYRSYIGEPDETVDVYLGFGLFFAAITVALLAFGAFVYSNRFTAPALYTYREVAFALGMATLPLALLGIVVLLPVDRRGVVSGLTGTVVCLAAIGAFVWAYPFDWDVGSTTYSLPVMVVYGSGIAALLGSTGAALVAYHIDRARPRPESLEPAEEDREESYTDEEIRGDIDEAMADVELNWGGVARTETSPLQLSSEFDDVDASGLEVEATRVESDGVEDQVAGLRTVKGGERKTARSASTVDDQTARLAELRQRSDEDGPSARDRPAVESLVSRVAGWLPRR